MNDKVVVTGMGVVSPLGNDLDTFWEAVCEGRSGIREIDRFDVSGYRSRIAGLAEACEPEGMTPKEIRRLDAYALYAVEAADQAVRQAGIDIEREDPDRCGIVVGSGIGGIGTISEQVMRLHEGGPRRVSPFMIAKGLTNMGSGNLAIRLGFRGPNKAVVTACAAANHCIGEASSLIRSGRVDVMVAGGAEASVVPIGIAGFSSMKALSTRNDEPEKACRPFDKDRDGFVVGEGAGLLVLESEEHARARGAEILGEIAGMGESCDAYHIVAPRPDGSGGASAISHALDAASVAPGDIDYINAHGTGTQQNEVAEALALQRVFGDGMPGVSSTKSMMGHLLGAASGVEAIVCLMAMREGIAPPSINFDTPDPECEVNLIANESREMNIALSLSNSLGFGGHNAALVLRRYDG